MYLCTQAEQTNGCYIERWSLAKTETTLCCTCGYFKLYLVHYA